MANYQKTIIKHNATHISLEHNNSLKIQNAKIKQEQINRDIKLIELYTKTPHYLDRFFGLSKQTE